MACVGNSYNTYRHSNARMVLCVLPMTMVHVLTQLPIAIHCCHYVVCKCDDCACRARGRTTVRCWFGKETSASSYTTQILVLHPHPGHSPVTFQVHSRGSSTPLDGRSFTGTIIRTYTTSGTKGTDTLMSPTQPTQRSLLLTIQLPRNLVALGRAGPSSLFFFEPTAMFLFFTYF